MMKRLVVLLLASISLRASDNVMEVQQEKEVFSLIPQVWRDVSNIALDLSIPPSDENCLCKSAIRPAKNEEFFTAIEHLREFLKRQKIEPTVVADLISTKLPPVIGNIVLAYGNYVSRELWLEAILSELPKRSDGRLGYYSTWGYPYLLGYRVNNAALLYIVNEILLDGGKSDYYAFLLATIQNLSEYYYDVFGVYKSITLPRILAAYNGKRFDDLETHTLEAMSQRLPHFINHVPLRHLTIRDKAQFFTPEKVLELAEQKIPQAGKKEREFKRRMRTISHTKKGLTAFLVLAALTLEAVMIDQEIKGKVPHGLSGLVPFPLTCMLACFYYFFLVPCFDGCERDEIRDLGFFEG